MPQTAREITPDPYDYDESDECDRCGGNGYIMEAEGDPSDWMEDTYCGADDEVIVCRKCNGTGVLK